MQLCWWYKIYWSKQWFLVLQEHVFELFSFSVKRVARWGCGILSLTSLTMKKVRVFLIHLLKKKQVLLKSKSPSLKIIRVLQRILRIFVKSKELSTVSSNFRREQALAHSCFLMRRSLSRTNMSTWEEDSFFTKAQNSCNDVDDTRCTDRGNYR